MTPVLHAEVLARFGHALSDPTRTRLLLALRDGPGYPSQLADLLGVTRQNLSNHLACLRGCGLVVAVPEGRRSRYELADHLGNVRAVLTDQRQRAPGGGALPALAAYYNYYAFGMLQPGRYAPGNASAQGRE